jgi:hypothetical protein
LEDTRTIFMKFDGSLDNRNGRVASPVIAASPISHLSVKGTVVDGIKIANMRAAHPVNKSVSIITEAVVIARGTDSLKLRLIRVATAKRPVGR